MQLALYGSIAWRHPLGFGQVVDWAREFGWDVVDARGMSVDVPGEVSRRMNAFGYDMLGPRQIRPSARRELRARFEEAGRPLSGIYCSSSLNLPGEMGTKYRELFCEYLQLGADLGVDWIRSINNTTETHQAGYPEMSDEEAYDRTVEGLRAVAQTAADLNVGLLLENNENTTTPDAQSLLRLQGDLGDVCPVGIVYDPVNAYFQGHDPVAGFDVLAGHIDILHVKNVRQHTDPQWDYMPRGNHSYEWTSLAEGDLNWQELIPRAAAGGFDGPIAFEYVNPFKGMPPGYWDTLPEPAEAAEREGKYLRAIVDGIG